MNACTVTTVLHDAVGGFELHLSSAVWMVDGHVPRAGARGGCARAETGQITLLHKPRTNEGEDRARQRLCD